MSARPIGRRLIAIALAGALTVAAACAAGGSSPRGSGRPTQTSATGSELVDRIINATQGDEITRRPWVRHSLKIASAHWHGAQPPCPVRVWTFDHPDPRVLGAGDQAGCAIWIDRTDIRYYRQREAKMRDLCTTVVHEYGHNLGVRHNDPRYPVMRPRSRYVAPRCKALDDKCWDVS